MEACSELKTIQLENINILKYQGYQGYKSVYKDKFNTNNEIMKFMKIVGASKKLKQETGIKIYNIPIHLRS